MRKETLESADVLQEPTNAFDAEAVRKDFPTLHQEIHGMPLVYLDSAASALKPKKVIDTISRFYAEDYSNVHRGVHSLSQRSTIQYEQSREKVRRYINAASDREIIFTRGTTEAINLVARSYGRDHIVEGDEIIISAMEHHANIVPWQMLREETGAVLRIIPMSDEGELSLDDYRSLFNERTKFVSIIHVSNALGTVNPVKEMTRIAHDHNVPVMIDGAQSIPHFGIDVRDLDCDFFAFSGHKVYGPTGIGILYGKEELLEVMPPYQGGGDMILSVTFEKTIYNELPNKFEAGTPNIAGAIGLGAALDYMQELDMDAASRHERELLDYATKRAEEFTGLTVIGRAAEKASVLSFLLCAVHPHDIGTIFDKEGVAIRAGHHCAQPVMKRLNIPATARASFAFYNTRDDVERLIGAMQKVLEVFN
jgi:cysteine desulfurase / selenocysteine lyase